MQLFTFGHPCEHQLRRTCIGGVGCPLNGYPDMWCCSFVKGKINFKRERPCEGQRCRWNFTHPMQTHFDTVTVVIQDGRNLAAKIEDSGPCGPPPAMLGPTPSAAMAAAAATAGGSGGAGGTASLPPWDMVAATAQEYAHVGDVVYCALQMLRNPATVCGRKLGQLFAFGSIKAHDGKLFGAYLRAAKRKTNDLLLLGAFEYLTHVSPYRAGGRKKQGDAADDLRSEMLEHLQQALTHNGALTDKDDQRQLQVIFILLLRSFIKNKRKAELLEVATAKFPIAAQRAEAAEAASAAAAQEKVAAAAAAAGASASAQAPPAGVAAKATGADNSEASAADAPATPQLPTPTSAGAPTTAAAAAATAVSQTTTTVTGTNPIAVPNGRGVAPISSSSVVLLSAGGGSSALRGANAIGGGANVGQAAATAAARATTVSTVCGGHHPQPASSDFSESPRYLAISRIPPAGGETDLTSSAGEGEPATSTSTSSEKLLTDLFSSPASFFRPIVLPKISDVALLGGLFSLLSMGALDGGSSSAASSPFTVSNQTNATNATTPPPPPQPGGNKAQQAVVSIASSSTVNGGVVGVLSADTASTNGAAATTTTPTLGAAVSLQSPVESVAGNNNNNITNNALHKVCGPASARALRWIQQHQQQQAAESTKMAILSSSRVEQRRQSSSAVIPCDGAADAFASAPSSSSPHTAVAAAAAASESAGAVTTAVPSAHLQHLHARTASTSTTTSTLNNNANNVSNFAPSSLGLGTGGSLMSGGSTSVAAAIAGANNRRPSIAAATSNVGGGTAALAAAKSATNSTPPNFSSSNLPALSSLTQSTSASGSYPNSGGSGKRQLLANNRNSKVSANVGPVSVGESPEGNMKQQQQQQRMPMAKKWGPSS